MTARQFERFLDLPGDELRRHLAVAQDDLARLYRELAFVQTEGARAKVNGFMRSAETTVAGRERDAASHAMESVCAEFDIRGQIAALNEEKQLLLLLLES
jgi:hypothetical protein